MNRYCELALPSEDCASRFPNPRIMTFRSALRGFIPAAALVLSACSTKATLEIEATNAWSGTLTENGETQTISGTGNRSIEMSTETFCWIVSKQSDEGRLAVYAKFKGLMTEDLGGVRETFAAYAAVKACAGDR
jgi:hypothetical protein